MLQEKGEGNPVLGGVSMEYEAVAGPTKFMVGTEQGVVLSCNRKAKTPADRVQGVYKGHHGPIYALERNPFFPKFFVSIGDWTARIWNEDLKTPILTTKYHSSYMTGGNWSPTRPGVFFTTRNDGVMDVWDFFYKQNDPVLSIEVSEAPLTSFNIQSAGQLIVAGDASGTTTMYELSEGLTVMQQNEKASIMQMLERESKREKNLETRQKELKQKARRESMAAAESEAAAGGDAHAAAGGGATDDVIKGIEKEYFDALKRETEKLAAEAGHE